jgi:hypothetical protein
MKRRYFIVLVFLSAIASGQKYDGVYESSDRNLKRGVISRLTIRNDSFELVYAFAPQRFIANVNSTEVVKAGEKTLSGLIDGRPRSWIPEGSAVRRYHGIWTVANTDEFKTTGWDFTAANMDESNVDTVYNFKQHLTIKDGDKLEFTFADGNKSTGFVSTTYYGSPAIFLDNFLSEIYLMQEHNPGQYSVH